MEKRKNISDPSRKKNRLTLFQQEEAEHYQNNYKDTVNQTA